MRVIAEHVRYQKIVKELDFPASSTSEDQLVYIYRSNSLTEGFLQWQWKQHRRGSPVEPRPGLPDEIFWSSQWATS